MNNEPFHNKDDEDEFDGAVVLADANGRESDSMCHPWLVFDKTNGTVAVADDYDVKVCT